MTPDLIPALAAFAFVTSITPGPNNLMLMASGANFGFRRTVPHMLGVALGFTAMTALVGAGLSRIFEIVPGSYAALQAVSVVYLLYLAWHVATAAPPDSAMPAGKPLSFLQAALFQWVNPKAWAMAMTATSVYAPGRTLEAVAIVALVFGAINLPSVGVWTILGQRMRHVLHNPRRLRLFNLAMALLLVASLYPALRH
jgi:threonine/homoserine/homoserine lactone efflux protein